MSPEEQRGVACRELASLPCIPQQAMRLPNGQNSALCACSQMVRVKKRDEVRGLILAVLTRWFAGRKGRDVRVEWTSSIHVAFVPDSDMGLCLSAG